MRSSRSLGIIYAFSAAILFGISTPLAKLLIGEVRPVMLAGLLYGGSGLGLSAWMMLRKFQRGKKPIAHLTRQDAPWRAGAVLAGGVAAPVLSGCMLRSATNTNIRMRKWHTNTRTSMTNTISMSMRDGQEPHAHFHRHTRLIQKHPHYPDIYHRHNHP